jgi:uncharacterized protein YodC (DUF2158 family)
MLQLAFRVSGGYVLSEGGPLCRVLSATGNYTCCLFRKEGIHGEFFLPHKWVKLKKTNG